MIRALSASSLPLRVKRIDGMGSAAWSSSNRADVNSCGTIRYFQSGRPPFFKYWIRSCSSSGQVLPAISRGEEPVKTLSSGVSNSCPATWQTRSTRVSPATRTLGCRSSSSNSAEERSCTKMASKVRNICRNKLPYQRKKTCLGRKTAEIRKVGTFRRFSSARCSNQNSYLTKMASAGSRRSRKRRALPGVSKGR